MSPKLETPNQSELAWIAENVARATAMAKKYGGDDEGLARPTLRGLDGLWATWSASMRASGSDPNGLINMIGLALGQHLVDELGLAWTIASDPHGTEIAVHGQPGDVLVFPCNLVAKRWQAGEAEFVARVGGELKRDIARLQQR